MTGDYMIKMTLFCATLLFAVCELLGVGVAELPSPEFADTEVVTNIAMSISCDNLSRLKFSIDLQAAPSNNVEIAIGQDADGDGHLSLDETSFTIGYDCGEWFTRSAESDSLTAEAVADSGAFRRVYSIHASKVDPSWNLMKVTRRGQGATNERSVVEPIVSGFILKML